MAKTKCSKAEPLNEQLQEIERQISGASCVASAIEGLAIEIIGKFSDDLELEPFAVAIRSMAREVDGELQKAAAALTANVSARSAEVAHG